MQFRKLVLSLCLGLACGLTALAPPAQACSTFCLTGPSGPVFGKNYDWSIGHGAVLINPRGKAKVASIPAGGNPARWISRYGSVTFNQYGREMPNGGLNEAGLVVEILWLDETRYPASDDRAELEQLQWIQYQLDTRATVPEVLAADAEVRIRPRPGVPVHFFVADRAGRVAAIEFLDGKMVAHTGKDLPVPALTNTVYADALAAWKRTGAQLGGSSEARFTRAAERVRSARVTTASEAVRYAFDTLSDVTHRSHTMWSLVYEPAAGRVWFRTRDHRPIRSIDLARLDFACSAPPKGLDLEARLEGDVTERFTRFGTSENLALVRRSVRATPFLKSMPDPAIEAVARYPDSLACSAAP